MSRDTVLIFGAGASHEYGGRLLSGFLRNVNDLKARDPKRSDFDELIQVATKARNAIRQLASNAYVDLENVEDLLSIIEMSERLGFRLIEDVSPSDLATTFRNAIARIVELSVTVNQRESGDILADPETPSSSGPYGGLFHELPALKDRCSIITFNYDCALEVEMRNMGVRVEWPSRLGLNPKAGEPGVPVFKLHGSCAWLRCSCGLPIVYDLDELRYPGDGKRIGTGDRRAILTDRLDRQSDDILIQHTLNAQAHAGCRLKDRRERYIVTPSLYKGNLTEFDTVQWAEAATALRNARHVVIVGYSWPNSDDFFRHFFAVGTAHGVYIDRILVVRPHSELESEAEVKAHYLKMLGPVTTGRFQYCPLTFKEWAHGPERMQYPIW